MTQTQTRRPRGQGLNLALATIAFAINFWAWNLIGPLSATYSTSLHLDPTQTALLVAVPVLVGSLGRIPAGALTDRIGGRLTFAIVSFLTIIPVLFVGFVSSYGTLLLGGFVLGLGGTTFAIGIPFVNAWYEPHRRGFATGVFGMGMGGTALSAFFTPRLSEAIGRGTTHVIVAVALAAIGVIMLVAARNSPLWEPSAASIGRRIGAVVRLRATWLGCFLYAVCFGGFVAFTTYLPTLLKALHGLDQSAAGLRTAGFAIAAVLARGIGGTLSDRFGPRPVMLVSFAATGVLAVAAAFDPPLEVPAGIEFVLLAFALGLGTGAVFALIGQEVDPSRVGGVTGFVGAAGGLGGYFPPLVMGVVYQATGSYAIGLMLLSDVAFAAAVTVWFAFGRRSASGDGAAGAVPPARRAGQADGLAGGPRPAVSEARPSEPHSGERTGPERPATG